MEHDLGRLKLEYCIENRRSRCRWEDNLWPKAPKGDTLINQTSATDWQMAVRWDNVISIMLYQVMLTLQSNSFPIVLMRLGGPHSRPKPHLKLWKYRESNPRPHDQESDKSGARPTRQSIIPIPSRINPIPIFYNNSSELNSRVQQSYENHHYKL